MLFYFFFTLAFTEWPRSLQSIAFSFLFFESCLHYEWPRNLHHECPRTTMSDLESFFISLDAHYIFLFFHFFFRRAGPQSRDSMSSLDSSHEWPRNIFLFHWMNIIFLFFAIFFSKSWTTKLRLICGSIKTLCLVVKWSLNK